MSQRAALFASMLLTMLCMALVGTAHLVTSIVIEVQTGSSVPVAAEESSETGINQPVAAVTILPTTQPLSTRTPLPAPTAQPTKAPSATPAPAYAIAPADALTLALNASPGSVATNATPEVVSIQNTAAYEVQLDTGKVYVDANNGAILLNNAAAAQQLESGPVDEQGALRAATTYLAGLNSPSEALGVRFGRAQGMRLYEITFANSYRVYVNADTGTVVAAQQP